MTGKRDVDPCTELEAALREQPDDVVVAHALTACVTGGELPEMAAFPALSERLSFSDEALGNFADLYLDAGIPKRARWLYRKALKLDEFDPEWTAREAACAMALVTVDDRDALIRPHAADDEALGRIGDALRRLGEEGQACTLFREAGQVDPDDPKWSERLEGCPS